MTKKEMVETIVKAEFALWKELQLRERLYGTMSMYTRTARNRWISVNELAEKLKLELLH